MASENELIMTFDIDTIQHLGVRLYSTLPPILSELIANAWDADATKVNIYLNDLGEKSIKIVDNGTGMSFEEINANFLLIGRNRRKQFDSTLLGRKSIGKKGVGKLAVFGIANRVIINTVKDSIENEFILDYKVLSGIRSKDKLKNEYKPEHSIKNRETTKPNGTTMLLTELKRKSSFDVINIATNLAKTFNIFTQEDTDESDPEKKAKKFICELTHNESEKIKVSEQMKYENIAYEFKWEYPKDFKVVLKGKNKYENKIKGTVYSNKSPLKSTENGFVLFSRGKMVQSNTFFENRANDQAHQYIVGFFEIDFIDDFNEEDLISTDRKSLTWENEELEPLKELMNSVIRYVVNSWKNKRETAKLEEIKESFGIDLKSWVASLDKVDRALAGNLIKKIVTSKLDTELAKEYAVYVKDMFHFKSFKNFATEIVEDKELDETKLLKLFKDWELVEITELANLAKIRLAVIENFEKLLSGNAKEVPTLHNFLKQFPWLLDPRIIEFKDEYKYSQILKDNFKEDKLEDKDKRIDFLCHSSGDTLYVIEIKRPNVKVGLKELEQLKNYLAFVEDNCFGTSEVSYKNVIGYIISNKLDTSTRVRKELQNGEGYFYFKRYIDMLETSKKYHQEFLAKKNEIEKRSTN